MTENRAIRIMTIPETVRALSSIGVYVDESTLRAWCRSNTIPCIKAGRKTLLNLDDVLGFLKMED